VNAVPPGGLPTLDSLEQGQPFAYHGIPSLGQLCTQSGFSRAPEILNQCLAALLEDSWNRFADTPFNLSQIVERMECSWRLLAREWPNIPVLSSELLRIAADDTHTIGWRSHAQGLEVARNFLHEQHIGVHCASTDSVSQLREGRTSSVILVKRCDVPALILNVSRDRDRAAVDLLQMTDTLQFANERLPGSAARVLGTGEASATVFGIKEMFPVLAVEYIADMYELHAVPRPTGPGIADLVLVSDFSSTDLSSLKMQGRYLSRDQSNGVWSEIVRTLTAIATFDWDEQTVRFCPIEVNDGDVVAGAAGRGLAVRLVATSGAVRTMPLWLWPYAMAMIGAAADDGSGHSLFWDEPELALSAMAEGLALEQASGLRMLAQAALTRRPSDLCDELPLGGRAAATLRMQIDRVNSWLHAVGTPT
jgi:hypothetical protein